MFLLPKIVPPFENPQFVQKELHLFSRRMILLAMILAAVGMVIRQNFFMPELQDSNHVFIRMVMFIPVVLMFVWGVLKIHQPISNRYKWTVVAVSWFLFALAKVTYGASINWTAPLLLCTFLCFSNIPPLAQPHVLRITQAIAGALLVLVFGASLLIDAPNTSEAGSALRHAIWAVGGAILFGLQWSRLLGNATALHQLGADRDAHEDAHSERQTLRFTIITAATMPLVMMVVTPWFDPQWSILIKSKFYLPVMLFFLVGVIGTTFYVKNDRLLQSTSWVLVLTILISSLTFTHVTIAEKQAGAQWIFAMAIALSTPRWRAAVASVCLLLWVYKFAISDQWTQNLTMTFIGSLCAVAVMFFLMRCSDRIEAQLKKHTSAKQASQGTEKSSEQTSLTSSLTASDVALSAGQKRMVALAMLLTGFVVGLASFMQHERLLAAGQAQAQSIRTVVLSHLRDSITELDGQSQRLRENFDTQKKLEAALRTNGYISSTVESVLRQRATMLLDLEPALLEVHMRSADGLKLNLVRQGQDPAAWPQALANGQHWMWDTPVERVGKNGPVTSSPLLLTWRIDPLEWLNSLASLFDESNQSISFDIELRAESSNGASRDTDRIWRHTRRALNDDQPLTLSDQPQSNLHVWQGKMPAQGVSATIRTWQANAGLSQPNRLLLTLQISLALIVLAGLQTQQFLRFKSLARLRRVQGQEVEKAQAEAAYLHARSDALEEVNRVKSRQAAVLEALPLAFCELYFSAEGDALIQYANPTFLALSGLSAAQALSKKVRYIDSLSENDHPEVARAIESARALQQGTHFNARYLIAGKVLHVQAMVTPVRDASGTVFWHSMAVDVTDRVLDAERIRQLSIDYESMAEVARHTTNAVFFTDPAGSITWMNAGACEATGLSIDEAIGLPYQNVFSPGDQAEGLSLPKQNWFTHSDDAVFELRCINKKTRRPYWLNVNMHAQRGERDQIIGTLTVATDITATKSVNAMLEEVNQKLNEVLIEAKSAVRAKTEFLNTMSHELRTPLNAIVGMAALLDNDTTLDAQQHARVKAIHQGGIDLNDVINDVLDYSALDQGEMRLGLEPFNLNETLQALKESFQTLAQDQALDFHIQIADNVPPRLVGDAPLLAKLLGHYLSNAFKFTAQGTVTLRVSADPLTAGTVKLTFEIQDTGIGLDAQTAQKMYAPFYQKESTNTRSYGGSGLGLSIAKKWVEQMNGEVGMSSDLGQGSVFWFSLPMRLPR